MGFACVFGATLSLLNGQGVVGVNLILERPAECLASTRRQLNWVVPGQRCKCPNSSGEGFSAIMLWKQKNRLRTSPGAGDLGETDLRSRVC
jgi:hypothetical protein